MKNTRMHWSIGAAVAVVLLVLGAWWFWSLGEAQAGSPPAIRIEPVTQPVEIRHADQTEWTALSGGVDAAPGDSVRTGEGGEARIVWGDRGVTRLDPSSELSLETIPDDGSLAPGANIQLKLEGGRMWTRVIKLLDLGSSMQVESSNVVATVRGTSFGAARVADGAQFAVTQSVVDIQGAQGSRTLLRDNQWGDFGHDGVPRQVRDLNESDTWAATNRLQDVKEEKEALDGLRARLKDRADSLNRGPAFLINASESLHLSLAKGKASQDLANAYAERRLARLSVDPKPDDAAAFRRYANLAGDKRASLLGSWHGIATLRGRVGSGDVKDARSWRGELAPASVSGRSYLDAVSIDDRIDDALFRPSGRDEAAIPGIRADLVSFEKKIDGLDIPSNEKEGLHRKAEALHARIDNLGSVPMTDVPEIPASGTTPKAGTQILDTAKPAPTILKPAPTTQPVSYQRLQLLPSPSSVAVGQTVTLKLFGITSTGQADDITSKASFSTAAAGSLSGNIFVSSAVGTAIVNATYGTRTASASITVTKAAPVTTTGLQKIAFQFIGPTTMACSARSSFKIIATYADGKTSDVTMLTKLSVSDSKLIFVSTDGVVSSFCTVSSAVAYVNASYTEGVVTKTASAAITVARDPSATSSGCVGRQCP